MLKRLERAWRALWIKAFVALLRRRRAAHAPDWGSRPHRVLFLRHDRAGDMILSTGVLERIAASFPTIQLDVLASPANASLLEREPHIHRVIVFDKRHTASYAETIRSLRAGGYDAVIDCMVTAPSLTTMMLMFAAGAPHRVGIAGRGNDDAMTVTVDRVEAERHMTEELGQLALAFGIDPHGTDWSPRITLGDDERAWAESQWSAPPGQRLLVNISAGTAYRRWPRDRYVEVIRHVRERWPDAIVRLIASPAELDEARGVAAQAGNGASAVTTPSLRNAVAMVATADLVITPDTSIAHAAAAFKRPIVAMYAVGNVVRWAPYRTPSRVIAHASPTFADLPVASVLAACDELLDELAREGASRVDGGGAPLRDSR